MKELTTLNSKFTESEVKKENKFSRSPNFDFTCIHFNIYECLKWLEKSVWLINIKFCDSTDMLNKHKSRSSMVVFKTGVLDSLTKFTRNHLCGSQILLTYTRQSTEQIPYFNSPKVRDVSAVSRICEQIKEVLWAGNLFHLTQLQCSKYVRCIIIVISVWFYGYSECS